MQLIFKNDLNIIRERDLYMKEKTVDAPSAYICPISADIMKEPVLNIKTGHSYEKESITAWLEKNDTDPLTRNKITLQDLVPNRALAQAIESFNSPKQEVESDFTPEAYTCPLSMEIMSEPVINVKSGHTYEKASIEQWLAKNNTDPQTREETSMQDLVPNRAIAEAIKAFEDQTRLANKDVQVQEVKKSNVASNESQKVQNRLDLKEMQKGAQIPQKISRANPKPIIEEQKPEIQKSIPYNGAKPKPEVSVKEKATLKPAIIAKRNEFRMKLAYPQPVFISSKSTKISYLPSKGFKDRMAAQRATMYSDFIGLNSNYFSFFSLRKSSTNPKIFNQTSSLIVGIILASHLNFAIKKPNILFNILAINSLLDKQIDRLKFDMKQSGPSNSMR